ncbi:outer membrane protein [Methyloceanibacter stevinii]|uniref:outer membrane protein n=1 Tax=Methyloceanibacter stevinii TaxID=1774970 RepID=UPI00114C89E3|nr:porin family protein [Methyloceanibacter stevinii]
MLQRFQGGAHMARALLLSVGVAAACAVPSVGLASGSPSISKLQESIAALEARVNALAPLEQRVKVLEARLKQLEAETVDRDSSGPPETALVMASLAGTGSEQSPMRVSSPANDMEPKRENDWSGLYWGASVGFGGTGSSSRYWNRHQSRSTQEWDSTSSNRSDGSTNSNTDLSRSIQDTTEYVSGRSAGTEWNNGALADIYLGASMHVTPRVVAGIQVEGGLSQMLFQSTIPEEKRSRRTTGRGSSSSSSSDGDTGQSKSTETDSENQTYTYDEHNKLELDWMVSVIGRAGYLATPNTLVYGLAGWSYGHFNVEDLPFSVGYGQISDFGSHGITVGGGLEQRLSSKWTLRAEYRYTNFGKERFSKSARLTNSSRSKGSSSSVEGGSCCDSYTYQSSSKSAQTQSYSYQDTYQSNGYFDNDMHVGRIGVTRYFTLGD